MVLLAQHFDAMGKSQKAMELINEAIQHTPTEMQLYMIKAKIYKVTCKFEGLFRITIFCQLDCGLFVPLFELPFLHFCAAWWGPGGGCQMDGGGTGTGHCRQVCQL